MAKYYMINPFSTKFPVNPKYFANRTFELASFRRAFENSLNISPPRPENLAIVGNWGVGKTSILTKFMNIVNIEYADKIKTLCVKVSLPSIIKDMREFVADCIDKIYDSIIAEEKLSTKIKEEIFSWRVKSLSLGPLSIEKDKQEFKVSAGTQLRKSLIDLWRDYLKGFDIVLLMLDDIHYLVRTIPQALHDLRTVFQELPEYGCNYLLLVTGPKAIFSEIRDLAEPLVRFFDQYEIDNFSYEETKEAIFLPLKVENIQLEIESNVIDKIYSLTKGHPYFISFIMHDLIESANKKITSKSFEAQITDILSHLNIIKFEKDYEIASDTEKTILKQIAYTTQEVVEVGKLEIKGIKKSSIGRFINRLVEKDLLIKVERGKYSLYHPLFREFLLKK
jgi:hypothetical protein